MLRLILDIIFACALGIVIISVLPRLWAYLASNQTSQDRTDFIVTDDGWRIAVHKYSPQGPIIGKPVILCHGLAGNRFIFDLNNAPSLAEFLRARNRDVWVVELRGSGCSGRPGILLSDYPLTWRFDDHLNFDVECIIDHVIHETGANSVHWVGHSMGGMLIEAHLSRSSNRVASAVALGSPANFREMESHKFRHALKLRPLLNILPFNPLIPLIKCFAPLASLFPDFLSVFTCRENIEWSVVQKITAIGTELISSSALWLDMARFLEQGDLSDPSGRNYMDGLDKSSTPLLAICGTKDFMAPQSAALSVCEVGPSHHCVRESIVLGKKTGCENDYGHLDLLLGVNAHKEVFPLIEKWLDRWDKFDINDEHVLT